jgi:hypothetical protein
MKNILGKRILIKLRNTKPINRNKILELIKLSWKWKFGHKIEPIGFYNNLLDQDLDDRTIWLKNLLDTEILNVEDKEL